MSDFQVSQRCGDSSRLVTLLLGPENHVRTFQALYAGERVSLGVGDTYLRMHQGAVQLEGSSKDVTEVTRQLENTYPNRMEVLGDHPTMGTGMRLVPNPDYKPLPGEED